MPEPSTEAALPLLEETTTTAPNRASSPDSVPNNTAPSIKRRLYISHFLSTWNARMFEFGAVLFLVSAFPGTLLYTSVYALVRSLAVALLSSSLLGRWMDRNDRLSVLRSSIVWQRIPVAVSCLILLRLLSLSSSFSSNVLFACASLLACVEKLASVANTVAVERDWVVIISDSLEIPRQDLNASMRRIDLICKLIAPLFISFIDSYSTTTAVWTVCGLSTAWVVVEYLAIAQVYNAVPELHQHPSTHHHNSSSASSEELEQPQVETTSPWRTYVTSPVFLPSLSLSLLYLTVLSFAPQMITYLLHTGFTSLQVSCMRIAAVVSEISGTLLAPRAMRRIGPVRAGLWFVNWQFGWLSAAAAGYMFLTGKQDENEKENETEKLVAVCLVVGVTLSRLGLWGFDLNVQYLVQEETPPSQRAQFSATEMALQSFFELLSFACTIVFARPEMFRYPVLISYAALGLAAVCYAVYVRRVRGHLVHVKAPCIGLPDKNANRRVEFRASGFDC